MVLRTLSSNRPALAVVGPLLALGAFLPLIKTGEVKVISSGYPIDAVLAALAHPVFLPIILTAILLVVGSISVNTVFNQFELHSSPTYMPGFLYALCGLVLTFMQWSIPALLANIVLLLGMHSIMSVYRQARAHDPYFRAAFWFGLSALIFPPYLALLPGLWLAVLFNRTFQWREHMAVIIGFSIPFLYWFCFAFWTGQLSHLVLFVKILSFNPEQFIRSLDWWDTSFLTLTAIIFILGGFRFLVGAGKGSNKSRTEKMVLLIVSAALIVSVFVGYQFSGFWNLLPLSLPFAFLAGHWFTNYRFSLLAPFFFYALLVFAGLLIYKGYF
jgi:hypothetical protein